MTQLGMTDQLGMLETVKAKAYDENTKCLLYAYQPDHLFHGVPMSVTLTLQMPDDVFSTIRKGPAEFTNEMRLAAAVKWYELGQISQEKAAEIAGLPRADFLLSLARFCVSPFQETAAEIDLGLRDAD